MPLFLPLFALCELQAGAWYSAAPEPERKKVEKLAGALQVVLPDRAFARAYGKAEAELRRAGSPIPTMDLLIGVMAQAYGMPLLTRDATHFRHIQGLVVESY